MSNPFDLPDFDLEKAGNEIADLLDRIAATGTVRSTNVQSKSSITNTAEVKTYARPWQVMCRLTENAPWQHGVLRYRGKTKDRVWLNATGKTVWLDKKNVAAYVFGYRKSETQKTRVAVRDFLSPDPKMYSILVHSFPVGSATVPGDIYLKIADLLKKKLSVVAPGTTMTMSIHGSADDVNAGPKNTALVQQRHRSVAIEADRALFEWFRDLQQRQPFTKVRFRRNHAQIPQKEAYRFLFKKDPLHRSDPQIRPQLRSALFTIRLKGDSNFFTPRKMPKEVMDGLRSHLRKIKKKSGNTRERQNAHIAKILLDVGRVDLRARYFNGQDVRDFDYAHTVNYSVSTWMRLFAGGSSAWDDVLVDAQLGLPPLKKVESSLDRVRLRMRQAYKYAQRGDANQDGRGSQTEIKRYMANVGPTSVMYARKIN